jgi:GT2 family glycosyltransferase/glycosyltransferase involved in cell wall biosynthesis
LKPLRVIVNLALAGAAALAIWGVVIAVLVVGCVARLWPRRGDRPLSPPDTNDAAGLSNSNALTASVIIPNWDGRELLDECLPSVVADVAATPGQHEVIVVDNGSVDDSVAFLRANFPSVRVVALPSNEGFIGGCNAGARAARGRYLVMLNNDMKVAPGFLRTLLAGFQNPSVFAVTAQILFADPTKPRQETGKTYGRFARGELVLGHALPSNDDRAYSPVFYAGGGSSAYDRAKFSDLGGFDSLLHPFYVEDTDLSYRAWKRGWPSVLARDAIVYHKHRSTTSRRYSADFIQAMMDRNRILCYLKNVSDFGLLAKHGVGQSCLLFDGAMHDRLNLRPWRLAIERLPLLLRRVWGVRPTETWTDREIVDVLDHPRRYRARFAAPEPPELTDRLNIVFLSPYSMFPVAHGGAAFMYNVVVRLAARHQVSVLTFVDPGDDVERLRAELAANGASVTAIVRRPRERNYNPWRATPPGIGDFAIADYQRELDRLLDGDVDVVQIEYTQLAQYVAPSPIVASVLSEIDVTFLSYRRRIGSRRGLLEKVVAWLEWLKMFNYELAICRKFDLILTVTEHERQLLQSYLPRSVISSAARTGVDVRGLVPREQGTADPDTILFVGYFRHPPNVEAVLYLVEDVLPLVRAKRPGARLTIVGAHPPPSVLALGKRPGVHVTGFVDDVREYYRTHAVLAAPIWSGAGVRVKVLEAMAAGVPVVTTAIGAEGIHAENGRDLLIVDNAVAFADALVDLLSDPSRAARLARSAREVVEREYDWDVIVGKLEKLYYDTLRAKRSGEPTSEAVIGHEAVAR